MTSEQVMELFRRHAKVRQGNVYVCVCGELDPCSGVEHLAHVARIVAAATDEDFRLRAQARANALGQPDRGEREHLLAVDLDLTHLGRTVGFAVHRGDVLGVLQGSDRLGPEGPVHVSVRVDGVEHGYLVPGDHRVAVYP